MYIFYTQIRGEKVIELFCLFIIGYVFCQHDKITTIRMHFPF